MEARPGVGYEHYSGAWAVIFKETNLRGAYLIELDGLLAAEDP
jgi:hypothetical protein